MNNIAYLQVRLGDYAQAYELHFESLKLARELGHVPYQVDAMIWLGHECSKLGRTEQGVAYAREALALAGREGMRLLESAAATTLSELLLDDGQAEEADKILERNMSLIVDTGDQEGLSEALTVWGRVQRRLGQLPQAEQSLQEAVRLCRAICYPTQEAAALLELALVAEEVGNLRGALDLTREHHELKTKLHTEDIQRRTQALTLQLRTDELRHNAEVARLRNEELAEMNLMLRQTEAELMYQVSHDHLTALMNRSRLRERLTALLSQDQLPLGMILINLDQFKEINERYGQSCGDLVLIEVAQRLLHQVGPEDLVGRVSGDEFLVILPKIGGGPELDACAERLLEALRRLYRIENYLLEVTASMGTALAPEDGLDADELTKRVDLAMSHAKVADHAKIQRYTVELGEAEKERRRLEEELRVAIAAGELTLHYQPQFRLPHQQLSGCEALVRWHNPRRGLISPATFIPLAEESALIVDLGYWVMERACRQALEWDFVGRNLGMSVNVSAHQFEQPDFVERVRTILHTTGFPGEHLILELTESLVLRDISQAQRHVNDLHTHAIRIAIDDFGTGYSSLNMLAQLPFEHLKIDRSFVRDLTAQEAYAEPSRARVLMRGITGLAHSLQLKVIAEGVETDEQLSLLQELGCDKVQGYLLGRPVPPEEAAVWLERVQA
ncbi:putative bifunctional diguanylate cyclase/phosphodiesterase [Deinococcus radiophilus]|uniref:putative bifunctional diguanylate cyclase/phosphodiesterase n=1 Tax=Deinococcus radiophilus TaxID=32062 RepID=UPI001E5F116A|nr:EAL domain-containing protein [Deinococcus radiophilus]UFA50946.1 EAL domain-containing protein [Deinococcus radiophilus]